MKAGVLAMSWLPGFSGNFKYLVTGANPICDLDADGIAWFSFGDGSVIHLH